MTPNAFGSRRFCLWTFNSLIERKRERFQQLESEIADPRLFDNRKRASEIMREHAAMKELLAKWDELEIARQQLDDNRELAASEDAELAQMAQDEIPDSRETRRRTRVREFRSRSCRRTKTKTATRSSKFAPEPAEAKPRFSPPIFTGCTIAMPKRPG